MNNGKPVIAGLLQPTDIIKNKDFFLINLGVFEKIAREIEEKKSRLIITSFKKKNISQRCSKPAAIIFPKIGNKFKITELPKNRAIVELIKTSVTPGVNISLKEHFDILNKFVENSLCFSIIINKNIKNVLRALADMKL